MTEAGRRLHERGKRDFLQIEDIKLGDGPLAAWNRKIRADIEVRYTDGTVAYRGPIYDYVGFHGSVLILDAAEEPGGLINQGIRLGINGMAVGGKRQIIIEPDLVSGVLLIQGTRHQEGVRVRKEKLMVEATLTASCIPVLLRAIHLSSISRYLIDREVGCRNSDLPKRDPSTPIWHLY